MAKLKQLPKKTVEQLRLEQLQAECWYDLGDTTQIPTPNDLSDLWNDPEDPAFKKLVRYMRDPANFGFTCKHILNIRLFPYQLVMLQEMWEHKFPMVIAGRGSAKCITADSWIITDNGIQTIGDIIPNKDLILEKQFINLNVLGENGFNPVEYCWSNGLTKTIKIKTHMGFEIEGTPNHPIRVVRNSRLEWVELQNLKLDDYIPINRNTDVSWQANNLSPDHAWFLGSIIGDGGYTVRGRIGFTSNDQFMHDEVQRIAIDMFNKPFSKNKAGKYSYFLYGTEIWDKLFQVYGFNSAVCAEKDVPKIIYSASKQAIAAFISGLFDTDGTANKRRGISFCSKSRNLTYNLQKLLLLFGIVARVTPKLNKTYNRYYYLLTISNQDNLKLFYEYIGFRLLRKQKRLEALINNKVGNPNIDIIPRELIQKSVLSLSEKVRIMNRTHLSDSDKKFFTPYRIETYNPSYNKLKHSLNITSELQNEQDWIFLKKVSDQNYFYDKLESIEKSNNYTYDVHIPKDHSFISNGFISHNSYLLAVYVILRSLLKPEHKSAILGAGFRQSKVIFEYADKIWAGAPVLRDICRGYYSKQGPRRDTDRAILQICDSIASFLPVGDGEKIRGQRAHTLILDEFKSFSETIYELVVSLFTATSSDPVEKFIKLKQIELYESFGIEVDEKSLDFNQSILSGTPDYDFQHFARYWKRYKSIIESKGDKKVLEEIFKGTPQDWKDFSIIRLPYDKLPKGYLDEASIARSKATMHTTHFNMELGVIFPRDSAGFFKRTLLDSCVIKPDFDPQHFPQGIQVFRPSVVGNSKASYVYGIDPASEVDNFAITILEVCETYKKIVYVWTTSKHAYKREFDRGLTTETAFYGYVARKIRSLMRIFPCLRIGCDAQGGGVMVREALHDTNYINSDELPIWEIKDPENPKDTDMNNGLHILELVQFANSEWTNKANHGMRKDFESKTLIFPYYDTAALELAAIEDEQLQKLGKLKFDSLEECTFEIEELKNELTTIVQTQTTTGRDRWDTPEIKDLVTNKKGRLRKDRYSSLLIANTVARDVMTAQAPPDFNVRAVFAQQAAGNPKQEKTGNLWASGPEWFTSKTNAVFGGRR